MRGFAPISAATSEKVAAFLFGKTGINLGDEAISNMHRWNFCKRWESFA